MTKSENHKDAEAQNVLTYCDSGGDSIAVQCKNENSRSRRNILMEEIIAVLVFGIVIVGVSVVVTRSDIEYCWKQLKLCSRKHQTTRW